VTPGRKGPIVGVWIWAAGLAWAAALVATGLGLAAAVLAVMGRDVSIFLVPSVLGYSWMGCVLLARRPGHPMGRCCA
jgi:hypothetical protein